MEGRRKSDWLRWLGLLVCAVVLGFAGAASAQAGTPTPAQAGSRVLLLSPAQAELSARIRGQTRDLGIALELAEPSGPVDAAAAAQAAAARGADIVVWAEASGATELTLHILERETGRVRSRTVSTPPNETLASSTTAEMGGLVVRSELGALLAERKARHEAAAEAVPAPAPAIAATAGAPPPPPAAADPPARPRTPLAPGGPWWLALAYRASYPLESPGSWLHAIALTARRDLSGFALGLSLNGAFPVSLDGADARITLQRTQLRAEALKQWEPSARIRLGLGLAASVAFDRRSTERAGDSREPTAAAMLASGGFGILAELQCRFARNLGGFVAGGADGVPWRTRFVAEDDGQQAQIARLSWIDPWLMVGLFTRFGR